MTEASNKLILVISEQWISWLDCLDAQVDLDLHCSQCKLIPTQIWYFRVASLKTSKGIIQQLQMWSHNLVFYYMIENIVEKWINYSFFAPETSEIIYIRKGVEDIVKLSICSFIVIHRQKIYCFTLYLLQTHFDTSIADDFWKVIMSNFFFSQIVFNYVY